MAGIILYRGLSCLDARPIVVVMTEPRANPKTGPMMQVWILREDTPPNEAARQGLDASVCGACPLRPANGGGCYVVLRYGPLSVWKAFRRGSYGTHRPEPEHIRAFVDGRPVRLGAYGDPAAVPLWVWESLLDHAGGWAGYTHSWRVADPGLASYCMASVDGTLERYEAEHMGWRTFRTRLPEEDRQGGEAQCPAAKEAGNKLTCAECLYCSGLMGCGTGSVSIQAHGFAANTGYRRYRESQT